MEARGAGEPVVRAYRRGDAGPGLCSVTVGKPSVRLVIA